jgi:ribonuclease VapC
VILDSSAIIAIVLQEPGWEEFVRRLGGEEAVGVGAPTLVETALVLTARLGKNASPLLARFIQESHLAVVPFTEDHWRAAADAYTRFGKGRHPAGLNFGDCLAYAVAQLAGQPLLCRGTDFAKTDLRLG